VKRALISKLGRQKIQVKTGNAESTKFTQTTHKLYNVFSKKARGFLMTEIFNNAQK
jgi:hypothetical protein